MAIAYNKVPCILREVSLKNKPQCMLDASNKGTVPVLVVDNNGASQVVDESLDIMHWAFRQNNLKNLNHSTLSVSAEELAHPLVECNDDYFKYYLDRYKYADRYQEYSAEDYFNKALIFLETLEQNLLCSHTSSSRLHDNEAINYFLLHGEMSAIDMAIFPFVRQFAAVDNNQFAKLPFVKLQKWLTTMLTSVLFLSVMEKYPIWQPNHIPMRFCPWENSV